MSHPTGIQLGKHAVSEGSISATFQIENLKSYARNLFDYIKRDKYGRLANRSLELRVMRSSHGSSSEWGDLLLPSSAGRKCMKLGLALFFLTG
jgi:hypothetical protein